MKNVLFTEKIMDYSKFKSIFNNTIFEKSKSDLLTKIANSPERYVGLFRSSKPKTKIIQNLLQSYEIRFGDAFEIVIEEILKENQFKILDKKFNINGKKLVVDQIFSKNDKLFFVEQKIRDDHDSTKKTGQIDNFKKKLEVIKSEYKDYKILCGYFYFIDDSFTKNKEFYKKEIKNLTNSVKLVYGKEFFYDINIPECWNTIIDNLKRWKNEIPDLPEVNFDINDVDSFNEIKGVKPQIYNKLFSNESLKELLLVISPKQKVLKLLQQYFQTQYKKTNKPIFEEIHNKLKKIIENV